MNTQDSVNQSGSSELDKESSVTEPILSEGPTFHAVTKIFPASRMAHYGISDTLATIKALNATMRQNSMAAIFVPA